MRGTKWKPRFGPQGPQSRSPLSRGVCEPLQRQLGRLWRVFGARSGGRGSHVLRGRLPRGIRNRWTSYSVKEDGVEVRWENVHLRRVARARVLVLRVNCIHVYILARAHDPLFACIDVCFLPQLPQRLLTLALLNTARITWHETRKARPTLRYLRRRSRMVRLRYRPIRAPRLHERARLSYIRQTRSCPADKRDRTWIGGHGFIMKKLVKGGSPRKNAVKCLSSAHLVIWDDDVASNWDRVAGRGIRPVSSVDDRVKACLRRCEGRSGGLRWDRCSGSRRR